MDVVDARSLRSIFVIVCNSGIGSLCKIGVRPVTRKQVCIPHCLKERILESIPSEYGGHLKFFKTYHRLSENFFWQNMYKDTKNFVRSCTVCLSRKNAFKIPPEPHQPLEQSREPGETCHIDIFGPLKTTPKGNSYVFSMIDAFTKYIHIVPLPDIKSSTRFLKLSLITTLYTGVAHIN
ncbi:integrase catalytic domain-containing protein [Trichonephila clavipes]|nr:integrase catalytic domain-containing protein [Trichonephila clavipes]